MIDSLVSAISGIARVLRAVLGVPDYERYLAHVRSRHPEREPMSQTDFAQERMETRYSKPGARCC